MSHLRKLSSESNVPVTLPKSTLLPAFFPKSTFCVISFKINKCLTRNSSASSLAEGFLALIISDAAINDWRHRPTASCAMSSKMAGWNENQPQYYSNRGI